MSNILVRDKFSKRQIETMSMLDYSTVLIKEIEYLHERLLIGDDKMLEFQIKIKFFLELMSSCLDYTAVNIFELFSSDSPITDKSLRRVYFPFIEYQEEENILDSERRLGRAIKETLGSNVIMNYHLVSKIRNCQHIFHQNYNLWVTDFKKLRNNNVHRNLGVYHSKNDDNRVVDLGQGHSLVFKGGHSGVRSSDGVDYKTPDELAYFFKSPVIKQETKYYVFSDASEVHHNVIDFIKIVNIKITEIVNEIYLCLGNLEK